MNIALFGGTFNPIHLGHIKMCQDALNYSLADIIYVIPAGNSYFKIDVLPPEMRADMVKLALNEIKDSRLLYCDIELNRIGPSYSYETIAEFKNKFPNDKIIFMIGEDSAYSITKWKNPEYILNNSKLLVFRRRVNNNTDNNSSNNPNTLEKHLQLIKADYEIINYNYDISSSSIREALKNGDYSLNVHLPLSVAEYILNNKIYQAGN